MELLTVGIVAAIALVGTLDRSSAVVTAQHERAASERKTDLKPNDRSALMHPLRCQQTISKRGAGEKWRTHYVCADFTEATSGAN